MCCNMNQERLHTLRFMCRGVAFHGRLNCMQCLGGSVGCILKVWSGHA